MSMPAHYKETRRGWQGKKRGKAESRIQNSEARRKERQNLSKRVSALVFWILNSGFWILLFHFLLFSMLVASTSCIAAMARRLGASGNLRFKFVDESPFIKAEPSRTQPLPKSA